MKIVWVLPGTFMGGGIRVVIDYANRLAARGHEVSILTLQDVPDEMWLPVKVDIKPYSPQAARGADAMLATGWQTVESVMKAEAVARKYYFIQNRESYFLRDKDDQQRIESYYSLPLKPITISHWLADVLSLYDKESFVIHNGLDIGTVHEIRGLRGEGYRILVEGQRCAPWKRTEWAMLAAKCVPSSEVWTLTIGKGLRGADKEFCNVTYDSIPSIYSSCHVMLKMSNFEGYPSTPAEAMACGCGVVAADAPGTNEYCIDGLNCLTIPRYNLTAAVKALIRLKDSALREKLSLGGQATIRERFTCDDKVTALEAALSGEAHPSDMPCPYHSKKELEEIRTRSYPYVLPLAESLKKLERHNPQHTNRLAGYILYAIEKLSRKRG